MRHVCIACYAQETTWASMWPKVFMELGAFARRGLCSQACVAVFRLGANDVWEAFYMDDKAPYAQADPTERPFAAAYRREVPP